MQKNHSPIWNQDNIMLTKKLTMEGFSMKRNIVLILFCAVFLFTLVIIPGTSVQAADVVVYDTVAFCNVPAATPGDPSYSEMAKVQNSYGFAAHTNTGHYWPKPSS